MGKSIAVRAVYRVALRTSKGATDFLESGGVHVRWLDLLFLRVFVAFQVRFVLCYFVLESILVLAIWNLLLARYSSFSFPSIIALNQPGRPSVRDASIAVQVLRILRFEAFNCISTPNFPGISGKKCKSFKIPSGNSRLPASDPLGSFPWPHGVDILVKKRCRKQSLGCSYTSLPWFWGRVFASKDRYKAPLDALCSSLFNQLGSSLFTFNTWCYLLYLYPRWRAFRLLTLL